MLAVDAIYTQNLTKIFYHKREKVTAIKDINLSVGAGVFFCIVGPSGCGKTTLLRILAGLEAQTSGKIIMHANSKDKPLTGMVFQGDSVFPWLTVLENIAYGLKIRGVDPVTRKAAANHYLKLMGLSNFAGAYPHQLSGGMKQRINVARAFVSDPEILLLDEPFGALDEQNRLLLQQELLKIWDGSGKTAIFITHSIDEALVLGDKIVVMTAHPGSVKEIVDVNIDRPRDIIALRSSPAYTKLYQRIWSLLREEVEKTRERECAL